MANQNPEQNRQGRGSFTVCCMGSIMASDDLERIEEAFESGILLRPSPTRRFHFVDLVRAIGLLRGVKGLGGGAAVERLGRMIGAADHHVLILVDGLGLPLLERLPGNSFLRSMEPLTLQAVFPSTTACAMTTLATGRWPGRHAVPGWWTYLEEKRISIVTVRLQGRFTGKPIEDLGLTLEDLFPIRSFWSSMEGGSLSLLPEKIAHTPFSRYVSGGAPTAGYRDIDHAMEIVKGAITGSPEPGLLFLYLPQLDALSHEKGPNHPKVPNLLQKIDTSLRSLQESIGNKARIIITADHGQCLVPGTRKFLLERLDPLLTLLHTHPTGESNVPIFHVLRGKEERFCKAFRNRFGKHFALLSPEETESLGLFGPEGISALMNRRLGTFIGIALGPAALCSWPPVKNGYYNEGIHGGLTPEEMLVPLVLA
ncbi:MAG: alkaline phosphatase family protein [Deltaproteobacteria bacterium]|nr:alkaline phosphatase family protein [Deltaproteobacteria bacterium]MBW2016549.1 alkaline phosphatase family protein [Deltaproteobacteria bacterium]MBW2129542.1 alkaline phosphatase family protein [Deltaproteobacteria bacterium]MBW2303521.1 alkaline phosphatase family protein [Deltaproteobacteria bacterium]